MQRGGTASFPAVLLGNTVFINVLKMKRWGGLSGPPAVPDLIQFHVIHLNLTTCPLGL